MFSVKNKTILITGASRGIGKALALGFKQAGAKVYGTGTKPESISWMESSGISGIIMNVGSREQIKDVVHNIVKETDNIDCLINNAGITTITPASLIRDNEIDDIFDVNLKGVLRCSQSYYEVQKNKGGAIINIASIVAYNVLLATATYSASKAAVLQLTRSMAAEWGKRNIKVNTICPGIFLTDIYTNSSKITSNIDKIKKAIPMKRLGASQELIGAAIFLASEASSYMTGQSIVVDGGLLSYINI